MLRRLAVCCALIGCGGGASGGGYDSTMQRMMTAQSVGNDDSMIGTWTDASTQLVAVVIKDGDAYRGMVVNGYRSASDGSEGLPPLTSLEGGKVEGDRHKTAMKAIEEWGTTGVADIDIKMYLLSLGMWRNLHEKDELRCDKTRGYNFDMHKDKNGAPVLWISMYGGKGPNWPRTIYFQKSSEAIGDAAMAKIKDRANHCLAEGEAGKEPAAPAADPPPPT